MKSCLKKLSNLGREVALPSRRWQGKFAMPALACFFKLLFTSHRLFIRAHSSLRATLLTILYKLQPLVADMCLSPSSSLRIRSLSRANRNTGSAAHGTCDVIYHMLVSNACSRYITSVGRSQPSHMTTADHHSHHRCHCHHCHL